MSIVLKAKTDKQIKKKKLVDPQKRAFFSFEIKTVTKMFFILFFLLFYIALKTIESQMLFLSVFLITHKKMPKTAKMAILTVDNFFCAFSKIPTKRTLCVYSIVFKAESKPKHKEHFLGGGLKIKNALFWGSKMVLFKSQI